jgi:hypothetical protein
MISAMTRREVVGAGRGFVSVAFCLLSQGRAIDTDRAQLCTKKAPSERENFLYWVGMNGNGL